MKQLASAFLFLTPILAFQVALPRSAFSLGHPTNRIANTFTTNNPSACVICSAVSSKQEVNGDRCITTTDTNATKTVAATVENNDTPPTATDVQVHDTAKMDAGIYQFNKQLIDSVYNIICFLYPVKGSDRDFVRFYVLETVARVPYFAYLSMLHLRETFGERYDSMSERMRTHYAEADNELHHLLIMEHLGGNSSAIDRTVAQTMAFFYYWYVVGIYTWSQPAAYHLSELIEDHAYHTYDDFLNEHGDKLKAMPVPDIARKYYEQENPFLFEQFCTVKQNDDSNGAAANSSSVPLAARPRRPRLNSLYDVFVNVRDDEKEHWQTLCNLVQYNDMNAVDATRVKSTAPKES